ncbi:MAG: hypothetical protein IJN90_00020 [Bacilli bacterium]|nr:hypothetical protein [Bacilli bacterium]
MANNNAVVMSAANLDIIENNLGQLAKNIGNVSVNVEEVDTKVNKVTDSVKTIEDEIKNFMVEIRGSTIVSNAKQSIMMSQEELNKQYGHYDSVRRKINGIFQATDMNAVKKSTIENISEQVIIDTPNYWLAPALVSLCAWLTDNKDLANRALKEAMNRDDEKTSLLFCLVHLRANRYETALKWLTRYLEMQDPAKMESKIVTVLDAITNGSFGVDAKELCLQKIDSWIKELSSQPGYKEIQVDRWNAYLNSLINNTPNEDFDFIKKYTNELDKVNRILAVSNSQQNILSELKNIIKEEQNINISTTSQIDKLINMLVFNYENEELDLKKDIAKNRLIIEENGNVTKANERFKETEFAFQKATDFYSQLTNITIEYKNTKPTINTRKMAMALSKDWINEAYNNMSKSFENNDLNIDIKIDNWNGSTNNGQNEKELVQSLNDYIDQETHNDIYGKQLVDIKMIFTTIIGIIMMFVVIIALNQPMLAVVILIGILIFDAYVYYVNYTERQAKIKAREKRKENAKYILLNTIAEIVDFNFICKDSKETHDQINIFLNSLDYRNYIKGNDSKRNIAIGGNNE